MQSDTPRTDAENWIRDIGFEKWVSIDFARELERELAAAKAELVSKTDELAAAIKQRDEARELNKSWEQKAVTWLATPEAIARLQSYRDLGQQVAEAHSKIDLLRADLAAMRQQRDEARELYCRQIAYGLFRTTGVFDPQQVAIKRGWVGLFKANEPGSPKTTAPIHREPAPTPAPPPKKCCKGGNQSC